MKPFKAPYWSNAGQIVGVGKEDAVECMEAVEAFQRDLSEFTNTHLDTVNAYCDYWAATYVAALGCQVLPAKPIDIDGTQIYSFDLRPAENGNKAAVWVSLKEDVAPNRNWDSLSLDIRLAVLEVLAEWAYEYANFCLRIELDGDKAAGIEAEDVYLTGLGRFKIILLIWT